MKIKKKNGEEKSTQKCRSKVKEIVIQAGGVFFLLISVLPKPTRWSDDITSRLIPFTRFMLWKIQSGIFPPFFYVAIAEKDKLKTLKGILCAREKSDLTVIF